MDKAAYARMGAQEETHWWFAARREIIERLISGHCGLPESPKLLEAGCGTGGNLALLRKFGALDAFEFDADSRATAQAKSGMEIPFGALPDDLPFADRRYDLIVLLDVLEHIEQDEASLAALADMLEPDGRILITVPAMPWLWSKHDEVHHHFRRYTRRSLRAVAERAGYRVIETSYFNFFLFPLAVAKRTLDKITGSDSADDEIPGAALNRLFYGVFRQERHLVGRVPLPWGLSVYAILEKRPD